MSTIPEYKIAWSSWIIRIVAVLNVLYVLVEWTQGSPRPVQMRLSDTITILWLSISSIALPIGVIVEWLWLHRNRSAWGRIVVDGIFAFISFTITIGSIVFASLILGLLI